MAWIVELALECGSTCEAAHAVMVQMERIRVELSGNAQCVLRSRDEAIDEENNWWATLVPIINSRALDQLASPALVNEVAMELYAKLREARGYRFAYLGFDASQFNTASNLCGLVEHPEMTGLVLREDLYNSCGASKLFEVFAEGYVWRPYKSTASL